MLVQSEMVMDIGAIAPSFSLPNYQSAETNGSIVSLEGAAGAHGTVVMFICNHCPFVVHIRERLQALIANYQAQGVNCVAISANDVSTHPEDSPEHMMQQGYSCPYLYDANQQVARAYKAACTPDFYVFDGDLRCYYRGRFDASRPGNDSPVTGADLSAALDALLAGTTPYPHAQAPSMGCNIKWLNS